MATSTVGDIPDTYYYPPWYGQAVDFFGANIQRLMDGQMTPEEVLSKSAQDIQEKLINR